MKKKSTKKYPIPAAIPRETFTPNPAWFDLVASINTELLKRGFNSDQAYQLTYLLVSKSIIPPQ